MAGLTIDLQDGFDGDTVSIFIDGKEIYAQQGVRTRYQIGLADTVRFESNQDLVHIRITLPERSISSDLDLEIDKTPHLGVSIDSKGDIRLQPASKPFMYA